MSFQHTHLRLLLKIFRKLFKNGSDRLELELGFKVSVRVWVGVSIMVSVNIRVMGHHIRYLCWNIQDSRFKIQEYT